MPQPMTSAAKSARPWNRLTAVALGLTGLMGLFSVWLFVNPHSRLNPFPPPVEVGILPTSAPPVIAPAPAPQTGLRYPTLPPEWTKTLTPPPGPTRTPKPTFTPTLTFTPAPSTTAAPAAMPTPTQPPEVLVTGVVGHRQTLPLSCEARSAADWAAFFGLSIDEVEFLGRLPVSDNPEVGFVGDVNGEWGQLPPASYGIYAGPVAELLRTYGAQAQAYRGLTLNDLEKEIAGGRPVIVWIVGHVWEGQPLDYTATDGQTTTVARYEHTALLIGYTSARVTVLDGATTYTRSRELFLKSWSALGNMAILWKP